MAGRLEVKRGAPLRPRERSRLLLAISFVAAAACGGGAVPGAPTPIPSAPPTPPPPPPRVVVVSIDGLRPDALSRTEAPNIQGLAARGAFTWQAQTVMPSNTLPAHVSMLTGYLPSAHGITWDDEYRPDRPLRVSTVFSVVHGAGLRTAMVVGKAKLYYLNLPGSCDAYVLAGRGDADVANEAVVQMGTDFSLMFVHFPDTDLAGHANGWLSTTYEARIADVDAALGRMLEALPPNTTVILTADHGGDGRGHGTIAPVDMTIPWIIAGPKVPPNHRLTQRVNTTDTAATAAYVLGLTLPPDATGRPVLEAFSPAPAAAVTGP